VQLEKSATKNKRVGKQGNGRNGNQKIGQSEKSATKNEENMATQN